VSGCGVCARGAATVSALVALVLCSGTVTGCGSGTPAAAGTGPLRAAPGHRSRLQRPIHVASHVELRRHPRAVLEVAGSGVRRQAPAHPARLAEDAITSVRTSQRVVALSFDDGPNPLYTLKVLALLRAYGAHATFFAIGRRALAWPALVRAELAAGDEVGEHTFDHPHLPALPSGAIALELADGTRAVAQAGAPQARLFRPPYGQFDARVAAAAVRLHQRIVLWNLNLERLEQFQPPVQAVRTLLRRLRPGDIILCHDGVPPALASLAAKFRHGSRAMVTNKQLSRRGTLIALPALLAGLRERGFRVVTVSKLLRAGRAIQQGLDAVDDPWQYRRLVTTERRPAER
jgi:peptidoglycan-N-acetylglucosamine deacetylase